MFWWSGCGAINSRRRWPCSAEPCRVDVSFNKDLALHSRKETGNVERKTIERYATQSRVVFIELACAGPQYEQDVRGCRQWTLFAMQARAVGVQIAFF